MAMDCWSSFSFIYELEMELKVSLTFKQRTVGASGVVSYVPSYSFGYTAAAKVSSTPLANYPVVDTGETASYNARTEIAAPAPGTAFYGQDAQFQGLQPSYRDNQDGTVSDLNTGLMWVKARGGKTSWEQGAAGAAKSFVAGYSDWRMPTIKELYSLIQFTGYVLMDAK
jgi:hypothetical protein